MTQPQLIMRIFYLPLLSSELNTPALREKMRRWHYRRYFECLRQEATANREKNFSLGDEHHAHAMYHLTLARSLDTTLLR